MGETRVDLLHLLEDIRDAYPGDLEETILTEIVANSLDSGASRIRVLTDASAATFVAVDDGSGMARRELARYHDIAATTKARGEGIGFAGVGIKLGLLVCEEVLTETRRGTTHVATRWHLKSRHRAPWRWVPPPGFVEARGTAVSLHLRNPLSPLLDEGYVEATLRRHFQALFEPSFDDFLTERYPRGVEFRIAGRALRRNGEGAGERAPLEVRMPRRRRPIAVGYLERREASLGEDHQGMAVSTLGKVIRRGWEWLGLEPATPDRIAGLIEAPGLAGSLTLNKADFIRSGKRGLTYLAFRKAIQEAVATQFAAWGEGRDREENARLRAARPLERDLENVLVDLADEFPTLGALIERRAGGQRRLPVGGPEIVPATSTSPTAPAEPAPPAPSEAEPSPPAVSTMQAAGPRRPGRYSLAIAFEEGAEDGELGHLLESTVWVNTAHPAYRRAVASRSDGYHIALAVGMALAPLAVEPPALQGFLKAFLAGWGRALGRDRRRRKERPKR